MLASRDEQRLITVNSAGTAVEVLLADELGRKIADQRRGQERHHKVSACGRLRDDGERRGKRAHLAGNGATVPRNSIASEG